MNASTLCQICGKPAVSDAPQGLCPECLMKAGLGSASGQPGGTPRFVPPSVADLAKLFPQLEILELIGQGGMGAVYLAVHPVIGSRVAINLSGIELTDVKRGHVITTPGWLSPTVLIDLGRVDGAEGLKGYERAAIRMIGAHRPPKASPGVDLRDYRPEGGLMFPHLLETVVDGVRGSERIVVESVTLNPPIDEARFAGDYRTMAHGVNAMVGAHVALERRAVSIFAEFGRGNFDAELVAAELVFADP